MLLFRVGAEQRDHVMRRVRVRGPELGAVDAVAALDLLGLCARRREVGARIRLRHADAEKAFAPRHLRQDQLPLFFGAEAQQQRPGLPVADPVRADRRTGGQHFLKHHIAVEGADAHARHIVSASACRSSRARPSWR